MAKTILTPIDDRSRPGNEEPKK
jgi:hypothetical protein